MTLFEQYTANVPLFFPTKEMLLELHKAHPRHVLSEQSMYQVNNVDFGGPGLNRTSDPDVVRRWIDLADYYDLDAMPHIQYFESFDHLAHLLETTNLEEVSRQMRAHNGIREVETMRRWEEVLGALSR